MQQMPVVRQGFGATPDIVLRYPSESESVSNKSLFHPFGQHDA
jgi:hypothetical protein